MADSQKRNQLSRTDFYTACRLIAIAQRGGQLGDDLRVLSQYPGRAAAPDTTTAE